MENTQKHILAGWVKETGSSMTWLAEKIGVSREHLSRASHRKAILHKNHAAAVREATNGLVQVEDWPQVLE